MGGQRSRGEECRKGHSESKNNGFDSFNFISVWITSDRTFSFRGEVFPVDRDLTDLGGRDSRRTVGV